MHLRQIRFSHADARPFSAPQLALVVALHAVVWAAVAGSGTVVARPEAPALLVRIIAPKPQPVTAAAPALAKPQPAAMKQLAPRAPVQPRPLLTAAAAVPTAGSDARGSEAPAAAAAAPAAARTSAPSLEPAPLVEPRFDASYLDNPAPAYPPMSRRLGEEGKVVLRVFVEADGRAASVEVKDGSGSPRLDKAALDAVRRWKFEPARRGAEPVAAWVLVPIAFHLKG